MIAFDTFGARRRRDQFGFEELGGALSEIPDAGSGEVSLADVLRSGAEAAEVNWGVGAQDYIIEQDFPGSEPVATGIWDAGSTSERLREIAAGVESGLSRDEAISATLGGAPFDPTIRTGTIDWSAVLRAAPTAINTLAGVTSTIARTVGSLAGVRAGAPAGNPAAGGSPSPGLIQRFLGGQPMQGRITAPAGGGGGLAGGLLSEGNLILFGLVGVTGFLLLRKRR